MSTSRAQSAKDGRRDLVSWLPMPTLMKVPGPVGPTLERNKTGSLSNWQREALRRAKREVDRILLYNGLEDLETGTNKLPYGRGMHCVNLFLYLWAKNDSGHTCPYVKIPTTLIIRNGDIRFWFYMDENGETSEIKKRPVEDCTRINVMTALSEEIFPSKGNPNGKNYIKATHVTPPLAENDFNSAEYGIEINYFDSEKLKKVVSGGGGLPDGTMQQYVRPFCDANVILDCTWKPHFFYVSRITNEIAGYTPEGVLKDGSKTTKMKTGDVTDMLAKRLQQTCDAIAAHVYEVSPQKYRIDSMRLGFKKDHIGALWLLYCSDLIVSKLSDTPPCISKPRGYQLSREPPAVPTVRKVTGSSKEFQETLKQIEKNHGAKPAPPRQNRAGVPGARSPTRPPSTGPLFSSPRQRRKPRPATAQGVAHSWNSPEKLYQAPEPGSSTSQSPKHSSGRGSDSAMAPQTPRHERHRPSPTYWGAIHNGTKPIRPTSAPSAKKNPYFNAKYIGYDPSGGRKFDFSRLDKMSPLYRPSPGEEQNEEDCRERMRRAREMLSPYMDHYRALPRSSVLSKELTKQLGQQLVEEQWKYASTDGQSLSGQNPYQPATPRRSETRRPTTASIVNKSMKMATTVYKREALKLRRARSAPRHRHD